MVGAAAQRPLSRLEALHARLFAPVDAASLVVFRAAFGLVMLWEVWRYLAHDRVARYYVEPGFFFKYYGFSWVAPWPGDGMYWHFAGLGVLALLITLGAFYRLAAVLFFLGFAYVFLLDQAHYLNHFYMVILFSALLCVLPANRCWAVDARRKPGLRSETVPAWAVWAIRAQLEVLLIYAGLVKLNADWLQLEPLGMWLRARGHFPLIGDLFFEDWVIAVGAYGSIALHLIGAPLLLWRRTRLLVFAVYCSFHVFNHFLWTIGIFPWFTIAATLMFFEPDWPRRLKERALAWAARLLPTPTPAPAGALGGRLPPSTGALAPHPGRDRPRQTGPAGSRAGRRLVMGFLVIWFAVQVLFPLRHWLYAGNVNWTEEGHRFSWMMMLRSKRGTASFEVRDPATGRRWEVDLRDHLTWRQAHKMAERPDMILQFAHHLARLWAEEQGVPDAEVRATVLCSLNGRAPALLVDPRRDLAKVERNLWPADWILPLNVPFEVRADRPAAEARGSRRRPE